MTSDGWAVPGLRAGPPDGADTPEAAGLGRSRPRTFVHIGAMKTGTSFLQAVLWGNRERLRSDGVLFPGRKGWAEQVQAVRHVLEMRSLGGDPVPAAAWHRIRDDIAEWPHETAILSMEFLCVASPDQVERIVTDLGDREVHVVLTARDLARVVAAQWQESTQNGATWTWPDYLDGVMRNSGTPGRRFWRQQHLPRILRTWGSVVPRERLHLVTLPPPGGPRDVLWRRFCAAVGLVPERYDTESYAQNESLGVAAAELMRTVNTAAAGQLPPGVYDRQLKWFVAKTLLPARADDPRVGVPAEHRPWFAERSERLVEELDGLGVDVVGDLRDLISDRSAAAAADPSTVSDADRLAAAVEAIVALAQRADSMQLELRALRRAERAAAGARPGPEVSR